MADAQATSTPTPSATASAPDANPSEVQAEVFAEDVAMAQDGFLTVPSETVYVNNLNEQVKLTVLKETLRNLFRNYGPVLDVVAHRSMRMRGQAFVAMATPEAAAKAVKEAQRFPLYGKAMNLGFAKTRADAIVKRKTPDELDAHLEERKSKKKANRLHNPVTTTLHQKRKARKAQAQGIATGVPGAPQAGKAARNAAGDDYLPPNKILFVQELPETVTRDALESLFKQYSGFQEVRTVPAKKSIAFVEYDSEAASTAARDALFNAELDGVKIKITFAKKA